MNVPCPRCSRDLPQSGTVTVEDVDYPVFQCDECLSTVDIGGEKFEAAYTFVLDENGKPFDPAEVD